MGERETGTVWSSETGVGVSKVTAESLNVTGAFGRGKGRVGPNAESGSAVSNVGVRAERGANDSGCLMGVVRCSKGATSRLVFVPSELAPSGSD